MREVAMAVLAALLTAAPKKKPAGPDPEEFHGWSKDGTWLVYQVNGKNELVELYFCATDAEVPPTWPRELEEQEREDMNGLSCVHFLDPNKAPYQWKMKLVLPAPAKEHLGIEVSPELALDGENPGFVLLSGDQRQACYASGVRETSKLGKTWFHPTGRYAVAMIDGNFRHCAVTLKPRANGKKR